MSRNGRQHVADGVPGSPGDNGNRRTPGPPVLYIRQAAQLVGASAVQLRKWEEQQLITPARTDSGYRIYSGGDIERMRHIQSLLASGVNAEGIRRILDRSDHSSSAAAPAQGRSKAASTTIRERRKAAKLTLRELATRTGLSASYISSVERGNATPSIASLQKIGAVFDTNVLGLIEEAYEAPPLVVRAQSRRILRGGDGVQIEDMSTADTSLEPLLFTFEPGSGSNGAIAHEGEEFLFVIAGELFLRLDGSDDYHLQAGDSMSFRSERAHEFGNPDGPGTTTVLWINTPRTF